MVLSHVVMGAIVAVVVFLLLCEFLLPAFRIKPYSFVIIKSSGKSGTVVSIPWLGNLWHTWVQVNTGVAGCRVWVRVHRRDIHVIHE